MRPITYIALSIFLTSAEAATAENVMQVVCDSGAVDENNMLPTLNDTVCITECKNRCSGELNEETLDDCLGEGTLAGCLFDVQLVKSTDLTHCMTHTTAANATHNAVLTLLSKAALSSYGDGSAVQSVSLELILQDITAVQNCNKAVKAGVSLSAFDSSACVISGTPNLSETFSIHDKGVRVNVTELFTGVYGSDKDLPLFIEFEDTDCSFGVSEANMLFSVTYKDGYRPAQSCMSTSGCEACLANGCTYCDWTGLTDVLIPDWMPDWIHQIKGDQTGACGINSAVCKTSAGKMRVNTCGATEMIAMGSAIALTLGSVYFI